MVASEASPFIKTGDLADLLGTLPQALLQQGEEVAVVLPLYRQTNLSGGFTAYENLRFAMGLRGFSVNIQEKVEQGVRYLFVQSPEFYDRDGLYGDQHGSFGDNQIRFGLLCQAALGVVRHLFPADIVHGFDWQAGLIPAFLRELYSLHPAYMGVKTVFTIHDMRHQGLFEPAAVRDLGLPQHVVSGGNLEFHGKVSLLKAGLVYSDALATQTRKYAEEILTPEGGFGLEGLIRHRQNALVGILGEDEPLSLAARHYKDLYRGLLA